LRALLYDVHGNHPALEAAVEDAHAAGADRFVLGGDYVLFGAFPAETVGLLRELDGVWIRGNGERWTADPASAPAAPLVQRAITHCRRELGDALVSDLDALPETIELDEVQFCHASPRSDVETFLPEPTDADTELLRGATQPVLVFGHSHLQFSREAGGRLLVNPGSVGMPFDADRRAAYALWDEHGEIELRRVAYDTDAYADAVRDQLFVTLGDAVNTLVDRIQQAAFAG
jgi:diadenosine tetraphosphatase ApaH/serine/threonine PP2A family protein phosphatase